MAQIIRSTIHFFTEGIWHINEASLPLIKRMFIGALKRITLSVSKYLEGNLPTHAASLTYASILSAVPILAIVFAIGRGLGQGSIIEKVVRENLGMNQEFTDTILGFINSYLAHTQNGIFLGVGLLLLLYTLMQLTGNIERTFNSIWHVKRSRNIYRRITDYLGVFVLLPILIVATSGLSIFLLTFAGELHDYQVLNSTVRVLITLSPYIICGLAMTLLYVYMPNTKVRFSAALFPGMLAGAAFQASQYFYIHSQIWMTGYNAIYGSFAALPLFMLWLQISWSICLFGATLCYANQNVKEYSSAHSVRDISRRYRDFLTLLIMSKVCKRFEKGMTPYTPQGLATECNIPISLVNDIIYELRTIDLLRETHDIDEEVIGFIPGQDISKITVNLVMQRIDKNGNERFANRPIGTIKNWEQIQKLRSQYLSSNDDLPLKDL